MTLRCVLVMVVAALTVPAASQQSIKDLALGEISHMKILMETYRVQIEKELSAMSNSTTDESWTGVDTTDTTLLDATQPSIENGPDATMTSDAMQPNTSSSSFDGTVGPMPNGPGNGPGNEETTAPLSNVTESETTATLPSITTATTPQLNETDNTTTPMLNVTETNSTTATSLLNVTDTNTTTTTPLFNATDTNTTLTTLSSIVLNGTNNSTITKEPETTNTTDATNTTRRLPIVHNVAFRGINLYAKPTSSCACGDNAGEKITSGQLLIVSNLNYDTSDDAS